MDNFKTTINLQASPNSIFTSLTNSIPKWWTEMFEGASNQEGAVFTIRFGANVFKTLEVEELVLNKKVVWYVTNSVIDISGLKNKTEWINTKIVWELDSDVNHTEVHLTHFGLTPQVECYNICEAGWHNFTNSLKSYVEKGKGTPFKLAENQITK